MDLSKLPRMGNSEQPTAPPTPDPRATPDIPVARTAPSVPLDYRAQDAAVPIGAQIWISAILGLIFVMIGKSFAQYTYAKLTGKVFHTNVNWTAGPLAGQEVAYPDLQGHVMLTDAGMFLFGLALLLEATALGLIGFTRIRPRGPLSVALGVCVLATLFNLYVVLVFFSGGGLPLHSLLALAVGGYIASYQFQQLRGGSVQKP